jgi:hypothetical protein
MKIIQMSKREVELLIEDKIRKNNSHWEKILNRIKNRLLKLEMGNGRRNND